MLDAYGLTKFKPYLDMVNSKYGLNFYHLTDDGSLKSLANLGFDKTKFIDHIDQIYSYAHYVDNGYEKFILLGKMDNDKYFYYQYRHYNDLKYIEIVLTKDYDKLIKSNNIPTNIIKIKSKKLD